MHAFMIRLGKSLMLPIAVLPIAGLLLRFGQPDLLDIDWLAAAGDSIFGALPMIFALGVAIGFARDEHGAAALSALIAHLVLNKSLEVMNPGINMGVLGGIIIGVMVGSLYNRFRDISLPAFLAFFGGKRFVPIVSGLSAIFVALAASYIWPPIQSAIANFGNWVIASDNLGIFVYGFANRMLIPVGLHHVLNNLVWFQFGDFTAIELGKEVVKHGDIARFFAGDPTAGAYMSGFFPVMMFGLPGAALAMIIAAKPGRRKVAAGILGSTALTALLTGITEPLEFAFMFLAFPLYILHAILTGLAGVIMNLMGVKLGFTFSAGLMDYALNYGIATNPKLLLPVGAAYFVGYFLIFSVAIRMFNLETPGREPEDVAETLDEEKAAPEGDVARAWVDALGGADNIIQAGNCATRLRLTLKDRSLLNEAALKKLGAAGIVGKNKEVQVIVGPQVDVLFSKMKVHL
jgi:PTS system N-acetylglucosamine-specific IIC component